MQYTITKPCTQDWNKMKPVEGGRFCDHCSKKVHDLTSGAALPGTGENFCGRMRSSKTQIISFKYFILRKNPWLFLQLFFFLFISNKIKAQAYRMLSKNMWLSRNIADTTQRKLILSGTVTDSAANEAIPFAIGQVFDREKNVIGQFTTDLHGTFFFEFDQKTLADTLVSLKLSYTGFASLEINDIPLSKTHTFIKVPMDCTIDRPIVMGRMARGSEYYIDGTAVNLNIEKEEEVQDEEVQDEEVIDPAKYKNLRNKENNGIKTRLDNAKER